MTGCSELKVGDNIICEDCGLELTVSKACDCGTHEGSCSAEGFSCCGDEMKKK